MTEPLKNNHYVPKVYLKSWASQEKEQIAVYTVTKDNETIRKQELKRLVRKKNLYTLPEFYSEEIRKLAEKVTLNIWENRYQEVMSTYYSRNNGEFTDEEIRGLIAFVIVQSFRSNKFKKDISKTLDKQGITYSQYLMYLTTVGFTLYLKNASVEVLKAGQGQSFVTSDNPATHWLRTKSEFKLIGNILEKKDGINYKNYVIICPVTPKILFVIAPNLDGINNGMKKKSTVNKLIDKKEVEFYNELIIKSADRIYIRTVN